MKEPWLGTRIVPVHAASVARLTVCTVKIARSSGFTRTRRDIATILRASVADVGARARLFSRRNGRQRCRPPRFLGVSLTIVKKRYRRPIIDLTGPQGNVFFLIGTAQRYAKLLHLNSDKITEEMKSSDYEHAVATFEKYFGKYVILER